MFINNFIYFYIGICALLIVFELVWVQYIKLYNTRKKMLKIKFKEQIIDFEKGINREINIQKLSKKLRNENNLVAFQSAYEDVIKRRNCSNYMKKILPVFIYLNGYYANRKNNMEKAYFAYVVGKDITPENAEQIDGLMETLYSFLNNKSINCRGNALSAICSVGKVNNVIRALQIINNNGSNANSILIANCLEKFSGNMHILSVKLINLFDKCIENVQIAIIKFLATIASDFDKELIEKLDDEYVSVDVKCEIMRYFQVNKSENMKEWLISELENEHIKANDLIVKAIGTLGYYEDARVDALLEKLQYSEDEMILETAHRSIEKKQKQKKLISI